MQLRFMCFLGILSPSLLERTRPDTKPLKPLNRFSFVLNIIQPPMNSPILSMQIRPWFMSVF